MDQAEQRQKGGVLSFIIIGAVLLGLLVGGVYLSKQQGRTASRSGTATNVPAPEKPAETEKKQDNTPAKQPTDNKPADNTSPSNNSSNTQSTPPQSAQPQSQAPRATPPAVATTGPSEIATTGTGDVLIAAVALGAVVGGMSFYRQSSARMHRAALRSSL